MDDNHWVGEIGISHALWVWWLCWLNENFDMWPKVVKNIYLKLGHYNRHDGQGRYTGNKFLRQYSILLSCLLLNWGLMTSLFVTIFKTWSYSKLVWWNLPLYLHYISMQLISLCYRPTQSYSIKCCQKWGE